MIEALRRGLIDGFCVGSPWNSVAVAEGVGVILLLGNEIVRRAPGKVLAVPAERGDADYVGALLGALAAAGSSPRRASRASSGIDRAPGMCPASYSRVGRTSTTTILRACSDSPAISTCRLRW